MNIISPDQKFARMQLFSELLKYIPNIQFVYNPIVLSNKYSEQFLKNLIKAKYQQTQYGCSADDLLEQEDLKAYHDILNEINQLFTQYQYQQYQQYQQMLKAYPNMPYSQPPTNSSYTQYGNQQYPNPQYPNPQYPNPQYPNQQYGNQQYPNQQYGNQQYPNQQYGSQQYGSQQYGSQQYGSQQYGSQQYGSQQYGSQQYGQQYGQQYAGNVQYPNYSQQQSQQQINGSKFANSQQPSNQTFIEQQQKDKKNDAQFQEQDNSKNKTKKTKNYVQKEQNQPQPQTQKINPIVIPPPPPEPPKPTKYTVEQIKSLILKFKSNNNTKNVSEQLIREVADINSWKKTQDIVQITQMKNTKKQSKGNQQGNQSNFMKAPNYKPQDMSVGGTYKPNQEIKLIIGSNQTLEQRILKNHIRERSEKVDFAKEREKEAASLGEVERAKIEIVFNLNLLAPENIKDIEKDLVVYLYEDEAICKVLIQQIIEKAWEQPKYASTYAKLCNNFSKKNASQFKFYKVEEGGTEKKSNPFKVFLVEQVQHSFDKDAHDQEQLSKSDKQIYLKNMKKKILGSVKFIAQLILSKVLSKKIIGICISQLLWKFLSYYYFFSNQNKFQHSFYDFYMEAAIQFIENIGQKFDTIDQTKSNTPYENIVKTVQNIISCNSPLPQSLDLSQLKSNDFFRLFLLIDEKILSKKNNRLSSLLKNLQQRRDNKWQKHFVGAEGPKKLSEIKKDIENEQKNQVTIIESKTKLQIQKLDEDVKQMLKNFQEDEKGKGWQKIYQKIQKTVKFEDFNLSYLKQVSQDNKENVLKRLNSFQIIVKGKYFSIQVFRQVWPQVIKTLAMLSCDLPFCSAAMAKILGIISDSRGLRLADFYYKSEDEDEEYFMNQVYTKLYYYTKNQEIKKFVGQISDKVTGLI